MALRKSREFNSTYLRLFNFLVMLNSQKKVALVKNSSEAVQTEKFIESRDKARLVRTEEADLVRTEEADLVRTKEARKRYLASLREAYAQKLFSKFMNELSGTLTMKNHKGTWHLVFSCGHENGMIQAKGKTLAHALINLATKSPSLGGVWGGTSKTTAL